MFTTTDIEVTLRKILQKIDEVRTGVGRVATAKPEWVSSTFALVVPDGSRKKVVYYTPGTMYVDVDDYNHGDDKNAVRNTVNSLMEEVFRGDYVGAGDFLLNTSVAKLMTMFGSSMQVFNQFRRVRRGNGTLAVGLKDNDPNYYLYYNPKFMCQNMMVSLVYHKMLNPNFKIDLDAILSSTMFTLMHETLHVVNADINAKNGINVENSVKSEAERGIYNYVYDSRINTDLLKMLPVMHGAVLFDFVGDGTLFWMSIPTKFSERISSGGYDKDHPFLQVALPMLRPLLDQASRYSSEAVAIWVNFQELFGELNPTQVAGGIVEMRKLLGNPDIMRDMVDLNDYIDDTIKKVKEDMAKNTSQKLDEYKATLPAYTLDKSTGTICHTEVRNGVIYRYNGAGAAPAAPEAPPVREEDIDDAYLRGDLQVAYSLHDSADYTAIPDSDDVPKRYPVVRVMESVDEGGIYIVAGKFKVMARESAHILDSSGGFVPNITNLTVKCYSFRSDKDIDVPYTKFYQKLFDRDDFGPGVLVASNLFNGHGLVDRLHEDGVSAIVILTDVGISRHIVLADLRIVRKKEKGADFPYAPGQMVVRRIGGKTAAYWVVGKAQDTGDAVLRGATAEEYQEYVAALKGGKK